MHVTHITFHCLTMATEGFHVQIVQPTCMKQRADIEICSVGFGKTIALFAKYTQ